jgi:6-phosphogluconolactonase
VRAPRFPVPVAVVLACSVVVAGCGGPPPPRLLLVGTYTGEHSRGIYALRFDDRRGSLTPATLVAETRNPSFLAASGDGRHVYAVNEVSDAGEARSGGVTAFSLDPAGPTLQDIGRQLSMGADPCHLALDRTGRFLAVANYSGGTFAILPVGDDGTLGPALAVVGAEGAGPNAQRQQGPHGHQVVFDPSNKYLLAVDLGVDKVLVYRFDERTGALTPNEPAFTAVAPGSGPRHLAFHPDGTHVFVINELASTIATLGWDGRTGTLTPRFTVSTLPAGASGDNTTAEIAVHPGGRFLYASNRGDDSIAVFAIADDGALRLVHHEATRGRTPRHFTIDPTGRWLLVGNQNSNTITVFRIDDATGALTSTGTETPVGAPVCLLFPEPLMVSAGLSR